MNAPITYVPQFISKEKADELFKALWNELAWVRHDKVPRREYYANEINVPYTYGTPPHDRTYEPQPWNANLLYIKSWLETYMFVERAELTRFEVCFLNGYEDQSDQLGWHSDDSPEMDDDRPIAIISLGVEREIYFRESTNKSNIQGIQKVKLEHGSLCIMLPGMQDTHQHRIPKASFMCGERISLTFRGYKAT